MAAALDRTLEATQGTKEYVPSGLKFDNTGARPLFVPGFGGLAIDIERMPEERFAHGFDDWTQPRLTAREMTMLRVMNDVTDVTGWQTMLDDPDMLTSLRPSLFVAPLLSDAAWNWCVLELRDKAASERHLGYVQVFDSASTLVKSDSLILPELLIQIQESLLPLVRDVSSSQTVVDKHIRFESNESPSTSALEKLVPSPQVLRLVDPSLYCLTYGETRVLSKGVIVFPDKSLDSIGLGEPTAACHQRLFDDSLSGILDGIVFNENPLEPGQQSRLLRFSHRFQWLPCEVKFSGPPDSSAVRVTSYINNLHPVQHRALYKCVEEVISLSIAPWNEVLSRTGHYHKPPRILTFGVSWMPPCPDWAHNLQSLDSENRKPETRKSESHALFRQEYLETAQNLADFLTNPDPIFRGRGLPKMLQDNFLSRTMDWAFRMKYDTIKTHWLHPEPGMSFTYADWKIGDAHRAVIPPRREWVEPHGWADRPSMDVADPKNDVNSTLLQSSFRDQGLQVIVKIVSIELTPEEPCYDGTETDMRSFRSSVAPVDSCSRCDRDLINEEYKETEGSGEWYLDGTLSEHIVATTLVCVSSDNASPYSLALQVEATLDEERCHHEDDRLEELAATFEVWPHCGLGGTHGGVTALQILGRVNLPQGRLLTLPATIRRKLAQPVELLDKARSGHMRLLEIHLVDPHYRLCSTRNVPPQQHHWWAEAGMDRIDLSNRGLPREVVDKISEEVGDDWPMGYARAGELLGLRLTDELLARYAADTGVSCYNF